MLTLIINYWVKKMYEFDDEGFENIEIDRCMMCDSEFISYNGEDLCPSCAKVS